MMRVKNLVYVSGVTGYLGKIVALKLLSSGHQILLGGRKTPEFSKFSGELSGEFGDQLVGTILCDLSNQATWSEASKRLTEFEVSGYVNCSGKQGRIAPVSELDMEEYNAIFNINLLSSIFFTKHFLTMNKDNSDFSVIHFSGGGATSSRPYFSPYGLSKTALVRFVENVASEQQSRSFRINAVAPGVMPSQMQSEILNSEFMRNSKEKASAQASMDNPGEATSKVLDLVEFLLSEKSVGISGKLISAHWDNWTDWPNHLEELQSKELYTLRRLTARDRNLAWGDI